MIEILFLSSGKEGDVKIKSTIVEILFLSSSKKNDYEIHLQYLWKFYSSLREFCRKIYSNLQFVKFYSSSGLFCNLRCKSTCVEFLFLSSRGFALAY